MPHHHYKTFSFLFLSGMLIALFAAFQYEHPPQVSAQGCTGGTGQGSSLSGIYGWAWSDTIGWVCFGTSYCPAAGVLMDQSSNLTGYGWSDNIGWIQFGGLDTQSMPAGAGTQKKNAQINGNNVQGWVRALANNASWDGWISLSGDGYGPQLTGGQGVVGPLNGYAWGSSVIGWLQFNQVSAVAQNPIGVAFDPSFIAGNSRVRIGTATTLSWSATCMSSCSVRTHRGTLVPGSSVTSAVNLPTPNLTENTTYILTCYDSNGAPNNDSVFVGIVPITEEI